MRRETVFHQKMSSDYMIAARIILLLGGSLLVLLQETDFGDQTLNVFYCTKVNTAFYPGIPGPHL